MGTVWPGFVLLALVSLVMWRINARVFIPRQNALDLTLTAHLARVADRVRGAAWATLFTLLHRPGSVAEQIEALKDRISRTA